MAATVMPREAAGNAFYENNTAAHSEFHGRYDEVFLKNKLKITDKPSNYCYFL